jgi:glycosyltransferase involved in cell wall biosynthesis
MAQAVETFSPQRHRSSPVPFRIAMVAACPVPARRGTPLRVERLAEALCARGHQVELITYHIGDGDLHFPVHRIFDRRSHRNMPAGPSARKLFLYDPTLAVKVWQVIGRGGFDIVHAHHFEGLLVSQPARLRHRIPVVYDAHTMLRLELPCYGPRLSHWIARTGGGWLDGWLPRTADHIVAVTPDIRASLIERHGLTPERISVVMNGVEAGNFRVRETPASDGDVRLIYSGTLAPYQDIDLLLDAFARARRVRTDLKLCFSVSSSFEPYEEQARRLGVRDSIEVIADGFEELPRRLAASNIAVLPRTACPGIPQKLLNYMAAGKAIVSSAGSAKVIEHERNGLIVPNGDADAFARALLRLAGNPALARRLGDSARSDAEQAYSWRQSAETLERIYDQLSLRHKRVTSPEGV